MLKIALKLLHRAYKNNTKSIRLYGLLAVLLEIIAVGQLYVLNSVYGALYEGIQAIDTSAIWWNIGLFALIAMSLVATNGYMMYFINRLAFEIRRGLTLYELSALAEDCPVEVSLYGQRVQEDFRKFGESVCELTFAVLKSMLHLPVFLGVIISLTHWYTGVGVLVAVIGGTVLTRIVARRLVTAQAEQETNEATFRRQITPDLFKVVSAQFDVLNRLFKRLAFTQAGLGQAFVLLPFIILMPLYISKAIAMGQFFQAVNALGKIIDALSVLIDSRQVIVNVETCCVRLKEFV